MSSERSSSVQELQWELEYLRMANAALESQMVANSEQMEAMLRELEAQRNAALKARQNEKNLSNHVNRVLDSAGSLLFVLDLQGRVSAANKASREALGFDHAALGHFVLDGFLHPQEQAQLREGLPEPQRQAESPLLEQILRQQGYEAELRFLHGNGELHLYQLRGSSLHCPRGKLEGVVISANDVTALRSAQLAAEAATAAKASFLANMSHEIRTPMNAVLGLAHLLSKTSLDKRQSNYLLKIRQSADHLLGIINDILDFSKIEAGKLSLESADLSLEKLLNDSADLMAERLRAKNLELVFDCDNEVPDGLRGDFLRLSQVLLNFISNAVKFTERGQIVVRVNLLERAEQGLLLRFGVQDSGIGMSEEQVQRMFQPFSQADSSTTRKFGGTGLGLAISKNLAELMAGEVGVQSQLGRGSYFWFTAWLGLADQDPPLRGQALPLFEGKTALVVDDNDVARLALCQMLLELGFVAQGAGSGDEALAGLTSGRLRRPDLVVMDWQMPGLDGLQTSARLRQAPWLLPVPILLVTSYAPDDLAADAQRSSVNEILAKPISLARLREVLSDLMRVHAPGAAGPAPSPQPQAPDAAGLSAHLRGARILLVEDNELNQMVATELLQELLCEIELAANGAIALEMLEETRAGQRRAYQLVLMDMQMPVMDGLSATAKIRSQPFFERLPIIAMTANAMDEDRQRCERAGMNDFVSKPIEPELLERALQKWLPVMPAALAEAASTPAPAGPVSAPPPPPPPQGDQALLQSWNGVVGLDVASALPRMGGNATSYIRFLRKLALAEADCTARIRAALAAGDTEQARLHAHSAKGGAANLGVKVLANAAAKIEQGLIGGDTGSAALERSMQQFEQCLAVLQRTVAAENQAAPAA
ncbi:PAS domain S-box-containing protein [Paucibacter oligotrophus]|uniref:Sensory/regulatory protein RpfC n=1 Tax=Roseateles oligotrophus TaxID=1769250 RepID=A0A840L3Y1_9BURK|nr:response regulator [Roseateles oligotrophus]MBB4842511.1 PAS domain S-box-containing protein [Roseateles oligotrophus]